MDHFACSDIPAKWMPSDKQRFALGHTAPLLCLAAALTLGGSAYAQVVVNDPAQTMVMNNANSRFSPVREGSSLDSTVPADAKAKPEHSSAPVAPAAMPDTAPSASSTTSPVAAIPADDPIRAKAVLVDINSETLNYDKDHDVYVATGAVHMVISEQNSELYSDRLTYDRNQELAIAEGRVIIIKNGQRTEGNYAKIDLTRRSALIKDAMTVVSAVRVKAKQSFVNNNELILENGKMIISGVLYQQLAAKGGLSNISQSTGKGAQQARLRPKWRVSYLSHNGSCTV